MQEENAAFQGGVVVSGHGWLNGAARKATVGCGSRFCEPDRFEA